MREQVTPACEMGLQEGGATSATLVVRECRERELDFDLKLGDGAGGIQ